MKIKGFIAASVLALSVATAGSAAETLTITTISPPTHPMNTGMLQGLIDMMEEATGGEVTGDLKFGLAPPPAVFDLVMDGAVDMAISFHGYLPGRFVGTKLIELPGYTGNAEQASAAYWRVHEAHLAALDEHRGLKLVALTAHGPGQIHARDPIASLDDLNGLKTRLGGGVASDVAAELGIIGIQVPGSKVYETLESGVADAVAMNIGERIGFNLNEVAKNVYEIPGGFYRGSFAVVMSPEAWDRLPETARTALEDKVFGEPASRMMGAVWDAHDANGRAVSEAADDVTIRDASEADVARFAEIAARVQAKVLSELEALGVDARAAQAMIQQEMNKLAAGG